MGVFGLCGEALQGQAAIELSRDFNPAHHNVIGSDRSMAEHVWAFSDFVEKGYKDRQQ